jgi:hypothetical protein
MTHYIPPCELNLPTGCGLRGTEDWRGLHVCPRCKAIAELDRAVAQ